MPKDWTNRTVTVIAILVTALSMAVGLVSSSVAWGLVCFLVLVALIMGLQPWLAARWRLRKEARAQFAERKKLDSEREARRKVLIPELAAWDPFCSAAGDMVEHFYKARDTKTIGEWNSFSAARSRAVALVLDLSEPAKSAALDLLKLFTEARKNDLDLYSVPAASLQNWLLDRNIRYLHARRAVGLPGH